MKMKAQIAMLASGMLAIAATGIVFAIPAFAVSSPGDLSVNYGGSTWACAEINGSGNPVQMNNCFSTLRVLLSHLARHLRTDQV